MPEEEESGADHFKEGKEQLEKGAQNIVQGGIEIGKQQTRKLEYYRSNRSKLVEDFSNTIGNPKEPVISGLIVLTPIFVVLLAVDWLFEKISQIPGNQYFDISAIFGGLIDQSGALAYYMNQTFKMAMILGLGAVIVTVVGRLVRTGKGFRVEKGLDNFFGMIPFLGTLYDITKVTTETVLGGAEDLSEPVKVNHGDFRVNAFKTGNKTEDGREIVFMPTAPNITSGMVLEIPKEKMEETEEDAEEALTRILSAGFGQKDQEEVTEEEE